MWSKRTFLWVGWSANAIVSLVFSALALTSFEKVRSIREDLRGDSDPVERTRLALLGVLVSICMSVLVTIGFNIYTLMQMTGRWLSPKMLGGFGHGISMTASIYTAAFVLLGGLLLQAEAITVRFSLTGSGDRNVYRMSYVFAYFLTATQTFMFGLFIFCRSAFPDKENVLETIGGDAQPNAF